MVNAHAHRALSDAKATHECYQRLLDEARAASTDSRDFPSATGIGPLAGEVICFTGESPCFTRHELMQLVVDNGGGLSNNVTLKTTMLVDFSDGTTGKAAKARKYAERTSIRALPPQEFFSLIRFGEKKGTATKTSTDDNQIIKKNGRRCCASTTIGLFFLVVSALALILFVASLFDHELGSSVEPFVVFIAFGVCALAMLVGGGSE